MAVLLISLIYIAFISLGLPDSLLGSAWPVMRLELGAELSFAGVISMIVSGCTVISSFASDTVTRKLGAGLTTAISTGMTGVALLGFSLAPSKFVICLFAIPYGLGAGAIDAALNNYVALHFSARHMSWLHCFWGVGASISPFIMGAHLANGNNWRGGYTSVSVIQLILTVILFAALPLWKQKNGNSEASEKSIGILGAVRLPGAKNVLVGFFAYCAAEATAFVWASSYLTEHRELEAKDAATFASLFYIGMSVGRFLIGFIADRIGDKRLIRIGSATVILGLVLIALPMNDAVFALVGLIVAGVGCAPIYPSIIHSTPDNFGRENSQAIVGIQMASAYIGTTFIPPIFGVLAQHIGAWIFPYFIAVFIFIMIVMTEKLNKITER